MQFRTLFTFTFLFIIICVQNSLSSAIEPKRYGPEGRFKTWTYYPNSVYKYMGFYMNPTYIEFDEGESLGSATISTPKPDAWQFVPNGNKLFLKPIRDNADTTATIITSKRTYFFELHAKEATGPFDARLNFFVKFRYPVQNTSENSDEDESIIQYASNSAPDLSKPNKYNFNYTVAGDEIISPLKVFDDGNFTYMQFRDNNGVLPAIFAVDNKGYESPVNFRVTGDYVIIESTQKIFTLRNGADLTCVFNESAKKTTL